MDLRLAIVLPKLQLLLGREILVAEEDDAALGDEQRELVALLVRQILELQALDLRPDVHRQAGDLGGGGQERRLRLVGPRPGVVVLPLLAADLQHVLQVQRARRPVRVALGQVDAGLLEALERRLREPEGVFLRLRDVLDSLVYWCWCHCYRFFFLINITYN